VAEGLPKEEDQKNLLTIARQKNEFFRLRPIYKSRGRDEGTPTRIFKAQRGTAQHTSSSKNVEEQGVAPSSKKGEKLSEREAARGCVTGKGNAVRGQNAKGMKSSRG